MKPGPRGGGPGNSSRFQRMPDYMASSPPRPAFHREALARRSAPGRPRTPTTREPNAGAARCRSPEPGPRSWQPAPVQPSLRAF
jgi:hypothetical protein